MARQKRPRRKNEEKKVWLDLEWPSEYPEGRRRLVTGKISRELCDLVTKVMLSVPRRKVGEVGVREFNKLDKQALFEYYERVQYYMSLGYEIGIHKEIVEYYRDRAYQ